MQTSSLDEERMAGEPTVSTSVPLASSTGFDSAWRYWLPVGLYAALIFGGSSVSTPPEAIASLLTKVSDKAIHMMEYGLFGALLYRACRHAAGPWIARHAVVIASVGCALYGLSDEIHQLFVPFREGDPLDLIADTTGGLLGASIWKWVEGRRPTARGRS
jgi:VanZ family protein